MLHQILTSAETHDRRCAHQNRIQPTRALLLEQHSIGQIETPVVSEDIEDDRLEADDVPRQSSRVAHNRHSHLAHRSCKASVDGVDLASDKVVQPMDSFGLRGSLDQSESQCKSYSCLGVRT